MIMKVKQFAGIILWVGMAPAGCSSDHQPVLPFFNSADFTPVWIVKSDPQYVSIHRIPNFTFVDQEGKIVTESNLNGKITVSDFFFTFCPGICPRLTKNMGVLQTAFSGDSSILLLSHSVTPDLDSVSKLKEYADLYGVHHERWRLLTGKRSEIYTVAREGYFADAETGIQKGPDEFLHTENFILVDPQRRIRGVYNGTNPTEIERLIEDIKILQHEL